MTIFATSAIKTTIAAAKIAIALLLGFVKWMKEDGRALLAAGCEKAVRFCYWRLTTLFAGAPVYVLLEGEIIV